MNCPLCGGSFKSLGQLKIFGKYPADYLRCGGCGFIQTDNPHWLKEAYATAITSTDIGPVWRADYLAKITKSLIHAFENPAGRFLDYGAGYGIFVRKMRDFGYDFRWLDKYSENLFAKGFEAEVPPKSKYQLVTAFEVFEHLPDPAGQIAEIFEYSSEVFFTTDLVPQNAPSLDEWIYYGAEHGQHIAFYTEESLHRVAQKAGLHFYSNGVNLHFFSRKKILPALYRLVIRKKVSGLFDFLYERPGLLGTDFMAGRERILKAQQNICPDRE